MRRPSARHLRRTKNPIPRSGPGLWRKLIVCAVLWLGSLYLWLVLVNCIFLLYFDGGEFLYRPMDLIQVVRENESARHLIYILALTSAVGIPTALLFNPNVSSKSGMREILPGIKTPLPAGENQYGSARWLSEREIKKFFFPVQMRARDRPMQELQDMGYDDLEDIEPEPTHQDYQPFPGGGLVVGQTQHGDILYVSSDETHTITFGATGSSKSRTIVLPSACATALAGESMIFSDIKAELFIYLSPFLRRLGYEVITLDFIDPGKSDQYNFLQPVIDHIREGDITRAKQATWELVESLVGDTKGEPIWHNGECSVLACCIMAVVYDNRKCPQYQNLCNVYHFISRMCASQPGSEEIPLQTYLGNQPEDHPARSLVSISNVAHVRTRSSFFTSALATLRLFEDYNIASMTSRTSFDVYATGIKKRAIFIILPDEKEAYYPIASLFVDQHYQTTVGIARECGGTLPRRIEYFLDEVGNFTYIPALAKQFTAARSRNIRFHLFLQGTDQLDKVYGEKDSSIIRNNCHTWLYLMATEHHFLEELSKKLGNYTTKSPNLSSSSGDSGSSSSVSYGLIARPLLTPEELAKVERPYQVVVTPKGPAILYYPDISFTIFNSMLGLGDKEHNREVMIHRNSRRPERRIGAPDLWGIWRQYEQPQPSRQSNSMIDPLDF